MSKDRSSKKQPGQPRSKARRTPPARFSFAALSQLLCKIKTPGAVVAVTAIIGFVLIAIWSPIVRDLATCAWLMEKLKPAVR